MFWISSSLHEHVSEVSILPFFRSDHSYVFLCVAFPALPERGPRVWKLNTSLLRDETLCAEVCSFWVSWRSEKDSFPSLAVWWDAGKARLKDKTRHFSHGKAKSRRSTIYHLEIALEHLHRREDVAHLIKETKEKLELEHLHAAEGARIRSKEQWAEEGETSSAFFFCQEKAPFIYWHSRHYSEICFRHFTRLVPFLCSTFFCISFISPGRVLFYK